MHGRSVRSTPIAIEPAKEQAITRGEALFAAMLASQALTVPFEYMRHVSKIVDDPLITLRSKTSHVSLLVRLLVGYLIIRDRAAVVQKLSPQAARFPCLPPASVLGVVIADGTMARWHLDLTNGWSLFTPMPLSLMHTVGREQAGMIFLSFAGASET